MCVDIELQFIVYLMNVDMTKLYIYNDNTKRLQNYR